MTKRRTQDKPTLEEILAGHSPAVVELVDALRVLIRTTVPTASEAAYRGWHAIGYTHPTSGYFGAIFPQQASVNLGFEFGVLLPDPAGLLTETGKQVRYVELRPGSAIPDEAIGRLIHAALDLPPTRAAKLHLIEAMNL
jgi:hypothetical protein